MSGFSERYDLSRSVALGSGAHGTVCTVRRRGTNDVFAMKVVEARNSEDMASLRKEILLQKKLDHPNICKIIESFEDCQLGQFYIIMELCTGGPLVERMRKHREGMDEASAATLVLKMLSAVLYCHHHGVVHRDIKLDNMLFEDDTEDAELKLIDFGFASSVRPGHEKMCDHLGTPSYMAPELWSDRHRLAYDSSVDMWALGASTYMLLSGTKPFHSDDKKEKARMIQQDALRFPPRGWAHISKDAKSFIAALMQKHPKDRLSASEAIKHPWIRQRSRGHSDPGDAAAALTRNSEIIASMEAYAEAEEMKQLALEVIAFATPPHLLERHRNIFQTIDVDDSGTIDLQEFKDAMSSSSQLSSERVEHIFQTIDVNDSGEIDYTEFLAATVSTHSADVVGHSVRAAFTMLDNDSDGFITRMDLHRALKGQLSAATVEKVMAPADPQGRVSYRRFREIVLGGAQAPLPMQTGG